MRMKSFMKKIYYLLIFLIVIVLWTYPVVHAAEKFDRQVRSWAEDCRSDVVARFEQAMKTGKLTQAQIFDTFYVPIPNTYPQRYQTQYDRFTDENFQNLLDSYLRKSRRLVYFVIVDKNGYVPTHNSKYTHKLTGNKELDSKLNRTKTIFSDRTGISAARNTESYLLQKYYRDNGEVIYDLSIPIFIRDQHWGCVRVGYN
jgi:methyl-accepting chemotaxis protein